MSKDEAWRVIEECRHWNVGQQSLSLAFGGPRTKEDFLLDEKRETLALAWRTIKENLWGDLSRSSEPK